jgi:hypothetical protein
MPNKLHDKVSVSSCKERAHKDCCEHKKQSPDNNCAKGTCNAMLSCGTCGFTITPSVSLLLSITDLNDQITHPFDIGELSDYQDNDWNPPKV